jgi:hypothetical protein
MKAFKSHNFNAQKRSGQRIPRSPAMNEICQALDVVEVKWDKLDIGKGAFVDYFGDHGLVRFVSHKADSLGSLWLFNIGMDRWEKRMNVEIPKDETTLIEMYQKLLAYAEGEGFRV